MKGREMCMIAFKSEEDRQVFEKKMMLWDMEYDEKVRMVWQYRGKNGYHSQLSDCMVHPVRESLICTLLSSTSSARLTASALSTPCLKVITA